MRGAHLDEQGEIIDRGHCRTNPSGVDKRFGDLDPIQIAREAGTHSIWISEQILDLGLAAMEWQDFEYPIRQLFEREFAGPGAEVKITQASRNARLKPIIQPRTPYMAENTLSKRRDIPT
jgi:hypothetical protein